LRSVREGGNANGKPLGVLAIHFDWETQAAHRRRHPGGRQKTRVLLVDSQIPRYRVLDGQGLLTERVPLKRRPQRFLQGRSGLQVAFHLTPGYETYKGLGWFGVIRVRGGRTQHRPQRRADLL